jgi:hypothetical protein
LDARGHRLTRPRPDGWGETGRIRGVVGRIDWGYFPAAALNGYTVTWRRDTYTLVGNLVSRNSYNLAQRPLHFIAPHKGGEWRWELRDFRIADERPVVTGTLGPLLP